MDPKIYIYSESSPLSDEIIKELEYYDGIQFKNHSFNHSINNLPSNIKVIQFTKLSSFNQPIDNLPITLHKLNLGILFRQNLNNLPSTLKSLTLHGYPGKLDNLPPLLEELVIVNPYFDQDLNKIKYKIHAKQELGINSLSQNTPNLKILKISNYYYLPYYVDFPDSLDELHIAGNSYILSHCEKLPSNLKVLKVFDDLSNINENFAKKLPKSIQVAKCFCMMSGLCWDIGLDIRATKQDFLKDEDDTWISQYSGKF